MGSGEGCAELQQPPEGEFSDHSFLKASIGSIFAAWRAGNQPPANVATAKSTGRKGRTDNRYTHPFSVRAARGQPEGLTDLARAACGCGRAVNPSMLGSS